MLKIEKNLTEIEVKYIKKTSIKTKSKVLWKLTATLKILKF